MDLNDYKKEALKTNKRWESAKGNHLFLNDIKDPWAREFIIAMFHKIEDLETSMRTMENRRYG